ncbi:hypothetical protein ElyMa_005156000 [Elysia marginata]|uniref:Uncharacterized protein n=1 Tax=Elysia marginata TaxID=1093978 RepID=A0AAV4JRQ3_9GAST|nr:hypothetical protein ElyMa_005156000 [Elysia marginata]
MDPHPSPQNPFDIMVTALAAQNQLMNRPNRHISYINTAHTVPFRPLNVQAQQIPPAVAVSFPQTPQPADQQHQIQSVPLHSPFPIAQAGIPTYQHQYPHQQQQQQQSLTPMVMGNAIAPQNAFLILPSYHQSHTSPCVGTSFTPQMQFSPPPVSVHYSAYSSNNPTSTAPQPPPYPGRIPTHLPPPPVTRFPSHSNRPPFGGNRAPAQIGIPVLPAPRPSVFPQIAVPGNSYNSTYGNGPLTPVGHLETVSIKNADKPGYYYQPVAPGEPSLVGYNPPLQPLTGVLRNNMSVASMVKFPQPTFQEPVQDQQLMANQQAIQSRTSTNQIAGGYQSGSYHPHFETPEVNVTQTIRIPYDTTSGEAGKQKHYERQHSSPELYNASSGVITEKSTGFEKDIQGTGIAEPKGAGHFGFNQEIAETSAFISHSATGNTAHYQQTPTPYIPHNAPSKYFNHQQTSAENVPHNAPGNVYHQQQTPAENVPHNAHAPGNVYHQQHTSTLNVPHKAPGNVYHQQQTPAENVPHNAPGNVYQHQQTPTKNVPHNAPSKFFNHQQTSAENVPHNAPSNVYHHQQTPTKNVPHNAPSNVYHHKQTPTKNVPHNAHAPGNVYHQQQTPTKNIPHKSPVNVFQGQQTPTPYYSQNASTVSKKSSSSPDVSGQRVLETSFEKSVEKDIDFLLDEDSGTELQNEASGFTALTVNLNKVDTGNLTSEQIAPDVLKSGLQETPSVNIMKINPYMQNSLIAQSSPLSGEDLALTRLREPANEVSFDSQHISTVPQCSPSGRKSPGGVPFTPDVSQEDWHNAPYSWSEKSKYSRQVGAHLEKSRAARELLLEQVDCSEPDFSQSHKGYRHSRDQGYRHSRDQGYRHLPDEENYRHAQDQESFLYPPDQESVRLPPDQDGNIPQPDSELPELRDVAEEYFGELHKLDSGESVSVNLTGAASAVAAASSDIDKSWHLDHEEFPPLMVAGTYKRGSELLLNSHGRPLSDSQGKLLSHSQGKPLTHSEGKPLSHSQGKLSPTKKAKFSPGDAKVTSSTCGEEVTSTLADRARRRITTDTGGGTGQQPLRE